MTQSEIIEFKGESKSLAEWAIQRGIKRETLWSRVHYRKWSIEEALGFKERPTKAGKFWPGDRSRITKEQQVIRYDYASGRKKLTALYRTWLNMKNRCCNKTGRDYASYGGRGIVVCEEWINDFDRFHADMAPSYQSNLMLERKDNNNGYSKDNCKWATRVQQNNNTRRNCYIEIQGQRKTLAEWCKELNLSPSKVQARMRKLKWSEEEALELISRTKLKEHDG